MRVAGDVRNIILCPLAVEAQALRRRGLDGLWDIHCCGPGAANVERWFAVEDRSGRSIVLAGLAGGLNPAIRPGSAFVISRVVDLNGQSWAPTWNVAEAVDSDEMIVASTVAALVSPQEKAEVLQQTGADLVDLESAAFAERAIVAGCRWAIVRGVSDDAGTALPAGIDGWVDDRGRTRLGRVALGLARRPWLCGDLMRLQKHSQAALAAVAAAFTASKRSISD